jgi:hypothetical protein
MRIILLGLTTANSDPGGKATASSPGEEVVMSIYGGLVPHESRRELKLTTRAVNAVSPTTPEFLRWSESPVTFDQIDYPDSIPKPGRFPLIFDPIVGMTQLTKSLMDGGSVLNLMHLDTLKGLGLTQDQVKGSPHLFYRVVSGKQSSPLEQIALHVTFRGASNCHTETLAFKVVNFSGPYHVILGWPCYVWFMAIPSYTYLNLKILRPADIISVEAKT